MTIGRTGCCTATTTDALSYIVENFRFGGFGFRVVTPQTIQRTTLYKNCGPDSGTVIDTKFLNIENGSVHKPSPTFLI
jgi:hypothetical protein